MRALFLIDNPLAEYLGRTLKELGVEVDGVEQVAHADFKVQSESYDAVLLERDRLGGFGYSQLLRWRRGGLRAHVLVLLPRGCDSFERVDALDAGADGYLLSPFCVEELRARFRALARRDEPAAPLVLRTYDLEIDVNARCARRGGRPIRLTRREFDLLHLLAHNRGRVVSRATIREHLYDAQGGDDQSNVIDVYVRYLRNKIDKGFDTPLILTRWGQGYLLRAEGA